MFSCSVLGVEHNYATECIAVLLSWRGGDAEGPLVSWMSRRSRMGREIAHTFERGTGAQVQTLGKEDFLKSRSWGLGEEDTERTLKKIRRT